MPHLVALFKKDFQLVALLRKDKVPFIRLTLFLAPILLAVGVFMFLSVYAPIPALFLAVAVAILSFYGILHLSEQEKEYIARYLNDEVAPDQPLVQFRVTPYYLAGVGAWVSEGHIDKFRFIESIKEQDKFIRNYTPADLDKLTLHTYAVTGLSERVGRPIIRIVSKDTPNAFPVTYLKPPYDNYTSEGLFNA
jgi:hypothetical protein